jgi:hypothetical protein
MCASKKRKKKNPALCCLWWIAQNAKAYSWFSALMAPLRPTGGFFFLFLMSDNFYLKKRKYSRIFKNSGLFVCALAVSFFLSFLSQSESWGRRQAPLLFIRLHHYVAFTQPSTFIRALHHFQWENINTRALARALWFLGSGVLKKRSPTPK